MKVLIDATCMNCIYKEDELLFGEIQESRTAKDPYIVLYPALNPDKSRIVMIDINRRREYEKSGYVFYDSKELINTKSKKKTYVVESGKIKLVTANYYCPKCKKFSLVFYVCEMSHWVTSEIFKKYFKTNYEFHW